MTTIAWDGDILAADSYLSKGSLVLSTCKKLFRMKSGALIGTAGDGDHRKLLKMLNNVRVEKDFPSHDILKEVEQDIEFLIILPNKQVFDLALDPPKKGADDDWIVNLDEIEGGYAAIGSGRYSAITALDLGFTAREAVEAGIRRDIYSGPPIRTMRLRP